ncbi:LOW QUALITY PROTEIN: exocyst complex component 1-like [Uloborus diversus]|uniref:LOW QUALITY PROTEIN: exocyst complex component 1-like n=1 Tax=Uloborus diversus TaxID=327109 RepID=UPI0024095B30|nr:LOW QUALITY PROTEIN: exocyst complex component 1-like [Uloborus diversus]
MASNRHTLHKEVFLPNDERLVGVVNVAKASKKKKTAVLCLAVNNEKPSLITVNQVKKSDKEGYKNKRSWQLRQLKLVDGKDESKPTCEFDLHFEKVYKWTAESVSEKNAFIKCLWKFCNYLPRQKPTFLNISKDLLQDQDSTPKMGVITPQIGEEVSVLDAEDYQALTSREESDLESLMAQHDFVIGNAEEFTEQLARELSELDAANIRSIMASEQKVQGLMNMLQTSLDEISELETRLNVYDDILKNVKDSVVQMEEKDARMKIQHKNNIKLLNELENMITKLDLSEKHRLALDGELKTPEGIVACTAAAKALQEAMNAHINPGLMKMAAFSEQRAELEKLENKFVLRLSRHLNNLFLHLGNEFEEILNSHTNDLSLPKHTFCHKELLPYTELMNWMKVTEPSSYSQSANVYTSSLFKLYDREIKLLFEIAKEKIVNKNGYEKEKKYKVSGSSQDLAWKSSIKMKTLSLLGMDPDQYGSDLDLVEWEEFDKTLESLLSVLEPICLAEQQFCMQFFGLQFEIPSSISNNQLTIPVPQGLSPTTSNNSLSRAGSEELLLSALKKEKQINEELRKNWGELFSSLEPELHSFITHFDKIDGFYSMYVLVRLSQHVMSAQDTGSYLSMTFASVLVQAKRNFDKFMKTQIKSIEEVKVSKKYKCGILPFIANFEKFARQAESIFKTSERRTDLDRWYSKLVKVMFDEVVKISAEHQKTPQEVIQMENFHHLFTVLFQLKIPCLEEERKEAKQKYNESLQAYVIQYFGRPLEKLNLFFEGVQNKVAQGVKENEIGYHLAFSKQELRKVIKEYPGKEVKKGLESLYKKVEKHLCEEENLLQVVWHSMQDEFIRQYKYIESLIERCYPGAKISLEFSINDILEFFSEIARSH